jgi:2-haloacid dehalogenase
MELSTVKALTFDVFGTVVDWRSTVVQELKQVAKVKGIKADWERFADTWRTEGYLEGTAKVRNKELPWMNADQLHSRMLEELLTRFDIEGLNEAEKDHLNRVWHRLKPWSDVISGMKRLRKSYILATLSNGNTALLVNMAKKTGLPWDCILSSEMIKSYKPDSKVYEMAADLLGLPANQVMMVAAHKFDLQAARTTGMKTAFVPRPLEFGTNPTEWGPGRAGDSDYYSNEPWIDLYATDFRELAEKLGT